MAQRDADISELIAKKVREEIELAITEEIVLASKRIEERVRGQVGSITARVLDRFSFERIGQTLRIEVKFDGLDKMGQ